MADETVQEFKTLKNPEELKRAKDILIKGGIESVPTFEKIYGVGSARKVITDTYELPEAPEEQGMLGNIIDQSPCLELYLLYYPVFLVLQVLQVTHMYL